MNAHADHEHEHTDVPVRTIGKFLVGLLVGGLLVVVVLGGLWRMFKAMEGEPTVSAFAGPRELPPQPRLQTAPVLDLVEIRERELKRLSSYGWADQATGKVHIPIERAMELLVQRGVPVRQQRPADTKPSDGRSNEPQAQ